ncbi:GNAT family N-acetyltransferase [Ilumatobacter sp.]|uniref:GNAT family N-acetyltransferase n=1 Tax=Ilumatobacter sp. TaxID=1967498 RepID=UPI003B51606D
MVSLRPATASDEPFLREVLAIAADWRPGTDVRSADEVLDDHAIARYLAGWPRPGDLGVVAHDRGTPVGAAWCRTFTGEDRGYGFVAADVPEVTIGVVEQRRGEGIGRRLLVALMGAASTIGAQRLSLSVESDNPALELYSQVGFVEVSRVADSPTMVADCRDLPRDPSATGSDVATESTT